MINVKQRERGMVTVQPIRDKNKIGAIKSRLRSNPRNYLLFVLGLNTALRIGDILKLKVSDVRGKKGEIRDILKVRQGKTGKEKRIAINEKVRKALEFFFSQSTVLEDNEFLFANRRTGKAISRVYAWMVLNKIAQEFELENFGTHSLRKTWGYQARKAGIDLSIIQEKLGHSSPAVTKRYLGITDDEVNKVEREFCL